MKDQAKILKWLSGELTPGELAEFSQTEDYRNFRRIAEASANLEAPYFDEEAHYSKLKQRMSSRRLEPKRSYNTAFYLKIAAVFVVIFAGSLLFFQNSPEEFSTGTSEIASFALPDDSAIVLNADSEFSYQPEKWNFQRSLHLQGEAFFKVKKGKKFTVETNKGSVTVVGTEFTVKSRNDEFEVRCYEGAVIVSFAQKEVLLKRNQSFLGTGNSVLGVVKFNDAIPTWAVQESSFEGVPLREVIRELEEQFGVEINSRNIDLDQLFTGSFTHSDIEIALKAVTVPLQIKFTAESDDKIVLYEE